MRPLEPRSRPRRWAPPLALLALALPAAAADEEPAPRWRAPIEIRQAAPFVQLALPPAAYAHSEAPGLADLRIVDARGERVPYAWLEPRAEARSDERRRAAKLYPLPARPGADGAWAVPVEIVVDADRVRVRSGGRSAARPGGVASPPAVARPGGWVVDLGERKPEEPAPRWLRLRWSGPDEFTAAYGLETSDDLRAWRPAAGGQLMALTSPTGPLTQPSVALPDRPGRYVRLIWNDPSTAPALSAAEGVVDERHRVAVDAPTELVFEGAPAAAGPDEPAAPRGAVGFDLGGILPLVRVEVRFATGTHVAPARLQGRDRPGERWRELGQGVFYRLERDGVATTSPPLELRQAARYVRVVPDERAAALDPKGTRLAVEAQLGRLVFAAQGTPPFALLAGAARARPAALPAATLVPDLAAERPRFGQAALGAWAEQAEAARRAEAERRDAEWRPRLLWAVLLAGVAVLGFMVWRLARTSAPPVAGASGAAEPPPA